MKGIAAAAAVLVAGAAVAAVVATARRRYLVVTVRGSSMSPTFDDAERVLTRRTRSPSSPGRGEVIVLRAPGEAAKISPLLVKRVAAVPGDEVPAEFRRVVLDQVVPPGHLLVRGDNNASADSRSFGLVDSRLVVGTVMTTAITAKEGKVMHLTTRLIVTMAAGAGALGLISMPATALAAPAASPRVLMPNCTPQVHPDYAHMSKTPGQVSAHAYWTRGTCTRASVGTVLVYLQEKINGKWMMEGHEGIAINILPGKIPLSGRPNARGTCGSKTKTEWRSVGIIHVNANGDSGTNQSTTKEQDLPCRI